MDATLALLQAHMRTDQWSSAAGADPEASQAAGAEGTRWVQDLAGLLATSTTPSAEGGKSTIADEDGAVYDVFTDAKVGICFWLASDCKLPEAWGRNGAAVM
eukprot:scaffold116017_cov18-Tisochrysis_lutea.AAC.3